MGFPTEIKGRVNVNDTHVTFLVGQTGDKHPFSSYFDILVGTPNSRERERERQTDRDRDKDRDRDGGRERQQSTTPNNEIYDDLCRCLAVSLPEF